MELAPDAATTTPGSARRGARARRGAPASATRQGWYVVRSQVDVTGPPGFWKVNQRGPKRSSGRSSRNEWYRGVQGIVTPPSEAPVAAATEAVARGWTP